MARRNRPNRPLFARGAGVGFRTFVLAIAALSIWFSDQRGVPALQDVRGALAAVLQPLYSISASPVSLSAASDQFRSNHVLMEQNRMLRETQLQLNAKLLTFEALQAENRRIRQLVSSASSLHERVTIAEVIAVNQDPYRHQITLDKGGNDGVYQGQALVDAFGVMGQVIRVNPSTSTALLITDAGHGVPVEINRTGLQTIARGGGDGRVLSLPFLPGNADVQVGDLLVTSGLGGRFPPGYPVGVVFDVKRGTAVHFMQATASPTAKLYQGRQALLVWSDRQVLSEIDNPVPDPNAPPPAVTSAPGLHLPEAAAKLPPSPAAPAGKATDRAPAVVQHFSPSPGAEPSANPVKATGAITPSPLQPKSTRPAGKKPLSALFPPEPTLNAPPPAAAAATPLAVNPGPSP